MCRCLNENSVIPDRTNWILIYIYIMCVQIYGLYLFFPIAISKESRSIFMELDANNASKVNVHNKLKPNRPVTLNRSQNLCGQEVVINIII